MNRFLRACLVILAVLVVTHLLLVFVLWGLPNFSEWEIGARITYLWVLFVVLAVAFMFVESR